MIRAAAALAVLAMAGGCMSGPGRGGDSGAAIGAQARAKHGADPVAAPPADVGAAEDPAGAAPPR